MPTMETREVIRCGECGLNQFVQLAKRECRRCRKAFRDPEPEPEPAVEAMEAADPEVVDDGRMPEFGRRLYRAMKKRGFTQAQLARKSGRQRTHLYKLMYGLLKPRLATCKSLADALGIPIDELISDDADTIKRNVVEDEFLMALSDALRLVPPSGWPFVLHMAQDLSKGQLTLPDWMLV